MILNDYLAPVRAAVLAEREETSSSLGQQLRIHEEIEGLPDWEDCRLAFFGVKEDRGGRSKGSAEGPDVVRRYLYALQGGEWDAPLADLGDIYAGERLSDTMVAVKEVSYQLLKRGVIPVLIGGSQDLTYGLYRAYDGMEQTVNLAAIDARFDLGKQDDPLQEGSYLSHVILQKPYILFNFSLLGYQTYYADPEEIRLMERMYFELHRLGRLHGQIQEAEPLLRDADLVSFDLAALRQGDAPGKAENSPNGFSAEEACALARYAGISDKTSAFGLFGFIPARDPFDSTAHLAAQMLWYFTEGVFSRKGDYPLRKKEEYERYTVLIEEGKYQLVFYKSPFSGRWWIEVPQKENGEIKHNRHQLIPCSARDYEEALRNEIPERWWQAMKKSI